MQNGTEPEQSRLKTIAVILGVLGFFGFVLYQAFLNFFVYTDGNPTRHDQRILADAEDGYAHAQYQMGVFLLSGRQGIEPDPVAARRWFEAAAAQDYAPAQFGLGDVYRHGKGVEKNPQEAARLFRLAAASGNLAAENGLGELFANGEGVEKSAEAALTHYRKAAEAGYAPAQRNMGIMAANGQGMQRDYAVAMSWYRKAADQTDGVAMANIGLLHEFGQGVEADPLRAWDCYFRASLWGNKGASRFMTRVEAALPPEWHQQGLYDRDGRDCLTGDAKRISKPVSRVRK